MAGGRIIKGKYQIIREIGRGAMGIVYEVRHEQLGSTLALKQLQMNLETNPDIARRFRHEARMMARLQHPNIVRVWDIDSEEDFGTFLVMEFINGPDLGKILRTRGRLTYADALRIGSAVAAALHTAHREGLVHRDVKPANILIEEHSMRAVVTDFGIAKQIKGDNEDSTVGTVGFLGTYRYSSPEQIRSERGVNIDGRADIYSLGVVLYEMFSGKKFLEGLSEGQITHLVGFHADWRPTLEYDELPPEDFRLLVERCLVRDRDARMADAGEIAQRLETCLRRADDAQRPDEYTAIAVAPPPPPTFVPESLTAVTQGPPEVAAPVPDPRVVVEIEQLQSTLAAEVSQLQALHQEWTAIGAAPGEGNGRATAALAERLDAIEGFKEAADFESARGALDDLRQEIAARRDQELAGLRAALDSRLNELQDQWSALSEAAGDFVAPEQTRAIDALLDSTRRALADEDRQTVLRGTAEGQRLLEEVQISARERCAADTQEALTSVGNRLRELRERSPAAASQLSLDMDAFETELQSALAAGRLRDASRHAQAALASVTAALRAAVEEEESLATAAHARLRDLLKQFPLAAAQTLAPEDVAAAQALEAQAADHLQRTAHRSAAAAYDEAARRYAAINEQILQHQAAQRDALAGELRGLLTRAADAPSEVIGDARRQAEALLDALPEDGAAAVAALQEARTRLAAQLDEAAAFAAADAGRTATEAAHQRVVDLEPSWRQRRRATGAMDKAVAAFKRRQWVTARDGYEQAAQVLVALEHELTGERVGQQAAAAQRQVDEVLSSLDLEAAAALAPEECARGEALRADAAQAAGRGDGGAAVAAYQGAATAYRTAGQRVSQQHAAQYAAAQQALAALVEQAASAPDALVHDARRQAAALLDTAPPQDLNAARAEIERARSALTATLDALPLYTTANERRVAAEARLSQARARAVPRRQLADADRFMKTAAAALANRNWAAARDAYEHADAALAAVEAAATARVAAEAEAAEAQRATAAVAAPRTAAAPATPFPVRWVGGAALAAGVVSVAAWLLYPSTPDTVTAPHTQPTVAARPTVAAQPTVPVESKPPPPVVPHIAKVSPPSDAVTLREGAQQQFSVAVDGIAPSESPPIEWKLDDRVVASNVMQWDYKPGYQDGRISPRTLSVLVGSGQRPDQSHTWQVTVDDVNRGPVLRDASYKPGSRITAKIGDTLDFRIKAADEDSDALQYAWSVDGKPAGDNAPELKLPVTAESQRVSLVVSDGKDSVPAEWSIAALAPVAPLKLEFSPARLETLRFNQPQEFALAVPPGVRVAGLQYAWSVDGQKVSDAPKFVLRDYTPSMVRDSPLVVSATVQDDQQRIFSREWKARVVPPLPEIKSVSPPADRAIDAEPSRAQTFAIEAGAPLGAQRFSYVYEVDGRPASPDGEGRLTFTPDDDSPHQIAGYVKDNYGQTSRQRIQWKLQAATIVKRVQEWLQQYESAWNARDAAAIGRLRGLTPDEVRKLEDSFKEKRDLRVTFSGVKTEKLDASRAKASYTRRDDWVGRDGEPVTRSRAVEQTFRLAGNQLQEAGESQ